MRNAHFSTFLQIFFIFSASHWNPMCSKNAPMGFPPKSSSKKGSCSLFSAFLPPPATHFLHFCCLRRCSPAAIAFSIRTQCLRPYISILTSVFWILPKLSHTFSLLVQRKNVKKEKTRLMKKSLSMTLIPAKRLNSLRFAPFRHSPFLTPEFRYGWRFFSMPKYNDDISNALKKQVFML